MYHEGYEKESVTCVDPRVSANRSYASHQECASRTCDDHQECASLTEYEAASTARAA